MEKIKNIKPIDIFINVGIFNSTLLGIDYPPRGILHRDDQLDIFKYVLTSLESILSLVNKVHIYVELEQCFQNRASELQKYTEQLFGTKLHYHNYRNIQQQQWQEASTKIESDTIWFLCNHDHFFAQPDLNMLKKCLYVMQNDPTQYKAIHFSHTPELLGAIQANKQNQELYYMDMSPDSIQIVNLETFKYWWFNQSYNKTFRRTDEKGYSVKIPMGVCYIPPVELCCHYDGYWVPGLYPAYVIPPGFFENNIRIRYGYPDKHKYWVNINPIIKNYSDLDQDGTDYKWVLEDVPLFWKDHISKIRINPNIDTEHMLWCRNTAKINRLKSRFDETSYFPARDNHTKLEPMIEKYITQFDPLFDKK